MGILTTARAATIVIALIVVVLQIIAWWKLFTKAGEPGWKSLIPVYSQYTQFKIAWKPTMFWITFVAGFLGGFLNNISSGSDSMALAVIVVILELIATVLQIVFYYQLAKSFGKGAGFTVGLIFLNPIFMLILAFGSAQYQKNTLSRNAAV